MNKHLYWERFAKGKIKTHVSCVKIRVPSPKEILSWSERCLCHSSYSSALHSKLPGSKYVGRIYSAQTVEHDTLKPISGGLFCEVAFGPIATNICACRRKKRWLEKYCETCGVQFTTTRLRRYQMGFILLAAPVVHLWALQGGYIANILGKKNSVLESIACGKVLCQSKIWSHPAKSSSLSDKFFESRELPVNWSTLLRNTLGHNVPSAKKFLSHKKNKIAKAKILSYKTQKLYNRENVLPFYQFILYKPDNFTKITGFFNSLNSKQISFPLPHYSKQKRGSGTERWENIKQHTNCFEASTGMTLNPLCTPQNDFLNIYKIKEQDITRDFGIFNQKDLLYWKIVNPKKNSLDSTYVPLPQLCFDLRSTPVVCPSTSFTEGEPTGTPSCILYDASHLNTRKHLNTKLVEGLPFDFVDGHNASTSTYPKGLRSKSPLTFGRRLALWARRSTFFVGLCPNTATTCPKGKSTGMSKNKPHLTQISLSNPKSSRNQKKVFRDESVFGFKNNFIPLDRRAYNLVERLLSLSKKQGQISLFYKNELKKKSTKKHLKHVSEDAAVKIVAYTGASVLFQTLKNLNLFLLDSLVSWKWEKANVKLKTFFISQNALTKEERKLRNKLAKAKRSITKRKSLVKSFLTTEQLPEWMILPILPVLPPALRPILELEANMIVVSDVNELYQSVIRCNDSLIGLLANRALEIDILTRQGYLHEGIERLFDKGAGTNVSPVKSLSQGFHGKKGLFRSHLLGKRVDYSGRSVIVVGPHLKLYECGLPKEMALVLFFPFLIARLKERKIVSSTSQAKQLILNKDKRIWQNLKALIYQHPVLLNRAPTLHRLGFQAFQPILVSGKAIILPALVCTGFNADFDGDQMGVHVPLSYMARSESWKLLYAKNNMLSPATGKSIINLSQEMILGCYCSSLILNKTFRSQSVSNFRFNFNLGLKHNSLNQPSIEVGKKGVIKKSSIPFSVDKIQNSLTSAYVHRRRVGFKANQKKATSAARRLALWGYAPSLHSPSAVTAAVTAAQQEGTRAEFLFYFTTFQDVYSYLNEGKITLQTPIWLRMPFFEDNQSLEQPLEIRLHSMGHFFRSYRQSQHHFSKDIKSKNQEKGITYIRTSAGRIQLNETFYSAWSQRH